MKKEKTKLFQLRMEKLLTQQELADLAGVSRDTIARLENGYRNFNNQTIEKVALALEVGKDDIV